MRRERIEELLNSVSVVLKEVAGEWGLPLAEDKEERLIMHSNISKTFLVRCVRGEQTIHYCKTSHYMQN